MAFHDLDDFLVVESVVLPIRGRDYAFPGDITARSGLRLQQLSERLRQAQEPGSETQPGDVVLTDAEETELRADLFGDTEAELIADGLTARHVTIVYWTLIAYHLYGEEAAEAYWNSQGKAPAPNRAARRKTPTKSRPARSPASSSAAQKTAATLPPGAASLSAGAR